MKVNNGSEVSEAAKAVTSDQVKVIEKTAEANKGQQVKVVAGSGQEVKAAVHAANEKPVTVNAGTTTSTAAKLKVKPVKAQPVKTSVKVSTAAKIGGLR